MENVIISAVRPWESTDAESGLHPDRKVEPQSNIDFCLYRCPYRDGECVNCLEGGVADSVGRPRKYDAELLRELLKLRKTATEICSTLGVSERTVRYYRQKLKSEEE